MRPEGNTKSPYGGSTDWPIRTLKEPWGQSETSKKLLSETGKELVFISFFCVCTSD